MPPSSADKVKVLIRNRQSYRTRHPDTIPQRVNKAAHGSARQHFQNIHITIPLQVALPRFCEYADLTHGQVRVTDQWNIKWIFADMIIIIWCLCPKVIVCIIIWIKCVLFPIYKLIKQRKDAVLKVVNGRAILFKQGLYYYLEMVKKNGGGPAPPLRLPRCFCAIAELFRLTPVERSFVKGNNLPARDDSSKTNNQQEMRDRAREMVEASTTIHPNLKAVILKWFDEWPLPPCQFSEEIRGKSYLITDPANCIGLMPALFGINDDTGAVPEGWDLTAHHLGIILKSFENKNPINEEWEDEAEEVEGRIKHALQHLTDHNVIGRLRLSDTTRRIKAELA
ncbi:unnamed protein product [Vitrella brassicaformis CCMP3155]|uniref:Uncharacterized protein n=1 Tax=Vitrella brassicaformis (strain CCMP3155) TaxID=1169540 RepID=A0A0G4GP51_VITBC|nr:unnamed protein product [Vitrella brassicaformis CCMP3155]|eukprot:CEM32064.1 unnamed protein product [Vitrella brassicaformis CCMP3155]